MKRTYPCQPIAGVGAVIVSHGKLLLEKRKNSPGKGKWTIPGGLVELGERTEQTVIREVKEETGLDVGAPRRIDVVNIINLDHNGVVAYHFVVVDYLVDFKGGVLKVASDADELKWVPLNEVKNYNLTRSFRVFFKRNRQKLEDSNQVV